MSSDTEKKADVVPYKTVGELLKFVRERSGMSRETVVQKHWDQRSPSRGMLNAHFKRSVEFMQDIELGWHSPTPDFEPWLKIAGATPVEIATAKVLVRFSFDDLRGLQIQEGAENLIKAIEIVMKKYMSICQETLDG